MPANQINFDWRNIPMNSNYPKIINPDYPLGHFKFALFDFDGTLSLIREGWQKIMKGYFFEELSKAPDAEDAESLRACIDDFVDKTTGKQTIYQCILLAEEIARRGGKPLDPQDYKDEYSRRLLEEVGHRIRGLEDKTISPEELLVPGGIEILKELKARGVKIFIASGTDEIYAAHEAELLGVTQYLAAPVYGAQRDYKSFSKKMVIERIIRENNLQGHKLVGFGDGFVEIENVKEYGGFSVGVATDEKHHDGREDEWKRERLIAAGADIIIPDFARAAELAKYLFPEV